MNDLTPMPEAQVFTAATVRRAVLPLPTVALRLPEEKLLDFLRAARVATIPQMAAMVLGEYERRGPRTPAGYSPSYRRSDPLARSLTKLTRARFIDRLDQGVHYFVRRQRGRFAGANHAVYALAAAERGWRRDDRKLGPLQILHAVAITDVFCALTLALRERRDYELAEWIQIREDLKTVWYANEP